MNPEQPQNPTNLFVGVCQYSITCKCGCTNPEPEKAKKAVGRSEEK
jgi:hypothetical protein